MTKCSQKHLSPHLQHCMHHGNLQRGNEPALHWSICWIPPFDNRVPIQSTQLAAIQARNDIFLWPGLFKISVHKYCPDSVETIKKHLDQSWQHIGSTHPHPIQLYVPMELSDHRANELNLLKNYPANSSHKLFPYQGTQWQPVHNGSKPFKCKFHPHPTYFSPFITVTSYLLTMPFYNGWKPFAWCYKLWSSTMRPDQPTVAPLPLSGTASTY